jgi:hypothetical protein
MAVWRQDMDLSAEQFVEIVNALDGGGNDESGSEQRRQPRLGLRARATVIPLSEGSHPAAITIQVRDISAAGIGFLHDKKMSLDEQFALVLPRTGDTPSVVLCSVAFWQPLARELYAIGARFIRVLRDGGAVPLPIQTGVAPADLAAEIQKLHRKAS